LQSRFRRRQRAVAAVAAAGGRNARHQFTA
jgi:hypothetical protein